MIFVNVELIAANDASLSKGLVLCRDIASKSRKEEGCAGFQVLRDTENPSKIVLLEKWESEAALEKHFTADYMVDFSASISEVTGGEISINKYTVQPASSW